MVKRRDGGPRRRSKSKRKRKDKKAKPIRRDGYTVKRALQEIDLSYIDERDNGKKGRRGFLTSSLIRALLLMYIRGMDSLLELERFLRRHREWRYFLGLKRTVKGRMRYIAPHRTTYNKLINRIGIEGMTEIFNLTVIQMIDKGIIKGRTLSIDASIIEAWFRDRDASLGYDSYRDIFVYGYKVHIVLDVDTCLPICVSVTKAGYGESRTLIPFVDLIHDRYPIEVEKWIGDSGYDGNLNRLHIIDILGAIPYIGLNPRNCKGKNEKEKMERRKKLCERFYKKEWIHEYWVDPDSDSFHDIMNSRTYSEQTFSVTRESLGLGRFRHRGIVWATAHAILICMSMLVVANAAIAVGKPDMMRCIKCFRL
ncbi:MAG: transposase [Thermoplasmata archaeon]